MALCWALTAVQSFDRARKSYQVPAQTCSGLVVWTDGCCCYFSCRPVQNPSRRCLLHLPRGSSQHLVPITNASLRCGSPSVVLAASAGVNSGTVGSQRTVYPKGWKCSCFCGTLWNMFGYERLAMIGIVLGRSSQTAEVSMAQSGLAVEKERSMQLS